MAQPTCFVIIGYGQKMDYEFSRIIDLDKTYEYIIQPVFTELGFLCFRASDIKHSGVIDVPMYENILKADFVLADLSTLNPNVLYELGIRHAVKKSSTIIISEDKQTYPFDLTHILIEKYNHLGLSIDYGEVNRFRKILKDKVEELLKNPKVDSPLYTFFPQLNVPTFTAEEIEEIKQNISEDGSLSDLLEEAEREKSENNHENAISILRKAKDLKQDNILVTQRLALATYKSKLPNPIEALNAAQSILSELHPETTTDLETLGLSGAINKRLYEETANVQYLNSSLRFYEKGFYVGNDYYNGINLAYLFNVKALQHDNKIEAIGDFGSAIRIRREILMICANRLDNKNGSEIDPSEKGWIYLAIAEAHMGLNQFDEEQVALQEGSQYFTAFHKSSYDDQRKKLAAAINEFNKLFPEI